MKKLLTSFVMTAVLAGCMSMGTMVDLDKVKGFKKGVTTEEEAIAVLGRPTAESSYGDIKTLSYSGTESHATGLFSAHSTSVFVMLQFQNDKLLSVTTSNSNGTMN